MDCILPVQERISFMNTTLDFSHCEVKTRNSSICSCQSWRPQKCRPCSMRGCANVRTYPVHAEYSMRFLESKPNTNDAPSKMTMVMWRPLVCRSPLRASQGSLANTCKATENLGRQPDAFHCICAEHGLDATAC